MPNTNATSDTAHFAKGTECEQATIIALLAVTPLPSEEMLEVMDTKAALNIMRWASYVADKFQERCQNHADELSDVNTHEGRRKRARLLDAANHAGATTANLRELESQIVEMKQILADKSYHRGKHISWPI